MLEELVYSAAQRALDQQSTALSDLRTRTSTLVAAATLSASFLGAAAIGRGAPALAVILAMAAFLLTGAFAGVVLWRARVSFAIDADRVQEELFPYREDPAAYLLRAGRGLHDARTSRSSSGGRLSSGSRSSHWGLRPFFGHWRWC
jgi:uncharacterized membrane protein (DUF485 family)